MDRLKYAAAQVTERGVNTNTRSVDAVVSDETIDSYGEVIDAASWRLTRYKANPVVLHQHNHSRPMGKGEDVRVEGGKLHARLVFANTLLGDELLQLYAERAMRAFSVGFRPGRVAEEIVNGKTVVRLLDCDLMEISCVSVPANPNALVKHKSLGLVPPAYELGSENVLDYLERRSHMTKEERLDEDVASSLEAHFPGYRAGFR